MGYFGEGEQRYTADAAGVLRDCEADIRAYLDGLPRLEKVTAICATCGERITVRAGHETEDTAFASRVCPGSTHPADPPPH